MEKEVAVIVDEQRRGVVLEKMMKQMEDTRKTGRPTSISFLLEKHF
jgi:hypothetical protein